MQNRAGETREIIIPENDQTSPNYIKYLEIVGLCGLIVLFFLSNLEIINLFSNIWWIFSLIFILVYLSTKIFLGSGDNEVYFIFVLPVIAITLWNFGAAHKFDLEPFLILTVAILYFCFPYKQATIGFLMIWTAVCCSAVLHQAHLSILIWLPLFAGIWGVVFWHLKHEKELIRSRFSTFENRARGMMNAAAKNETGSGSFIDKETQFAKAAASVMNLETVLQKILDIVYEIFHANSAFVFLLDPENGIYRVNVYRTRSKFFDSNATVEYDAKGWLAWVIQNKRYIRHERLTRSNQFPHYYSAKERILSCLYFPIIRKDIVEGVLGVDSHRSHSFGVDEEHYLNAFSELIVEIVDLFRKFQQKDKHADDLSIFYTSIKRIMETRLESGRRMELLIEISQLLKNSDEIAVAVADDNQNFVIRKAKGMSFPKLVGARIHAQSVIGEKISSTPEVVIVDPMVIKPEHQGYLTPAESMIRIESALIVPLPRESNIVSVLIMGSKKTDYYTHDDKYIFGTLAVQFGFALENAFNAQKIQELAVTDGLTGTFNHRYFQDSLSREIKRLKRDPAPLSLLMIDIDHFKKFNDTYGHQAGDDVLKGIARLLKEQAREIDIVARYGGEEFAVLLLKCDLKSAHQIADRIRKTCSKSVWKIGNQSVSVTMSIGVACHPVHAQLPAELITAADKALYKAKESGRNQVVIYQSDVPAA